MADGDLPGAAQPMTTALEELAQAADQTARDQQLLARRARDMARQRGRGRAWSSILEREKQPGALELLSASARRLASISGQFRLALGRALTAEGRSTRQIAKELGVTHQRVSTMLKPPIP